MNKKWLMYGGIGAAILGGYYVLFYLPNQAAQSTATDATASGAYPDLTYAAAPLGAGGSVPVGTDTGSTSSLAALMQAFAGPSQQQITDQLQAGYKTAQLTSGVSVFDSLLGYMKAHAGLHAIQAIVPNVGTIKIGPQPTKTVHVTTPAPKPKIPPTPKPKPIGLIKKAV